MSESAGTRRGLQRIVVRVREREVRLALLGDGDGARADVALAGRQHGTTLEAVEFDVLHGELEVHARGDLLHEVHVEAGVLAVLLELEGRVGDVRADGQRTLGDEVQATVPAGAGRGVVGTSAARAEREGTGGQGGQHCGFLGKHGYLT
ncbi:hypothetical protein MN0502_26850 [Arthrobacter sp. MN05-02]|nr:hypothetical protein MN0502_26850 [Arthrobacter sp. MN05-02]